MKKLLPVIFTIFSSLFSAAQTDGRRMDEVMQAATNVGEFNGVVLVARHDSILLFKGYGWRDYEHKILHDTNSIFQIGSITKQFTATVILWLQEKGKLRVNDKLSNFFPEYKYAGKITLRNLLTHTSGIYNYTDQHFLEDQGDKAFSQKDFWDIVKKETLSFEPGTRFEYSNSNYTLLGYIIEKVSGKSYEQMVREVIFNKAGMTHSGFDYAHLSNPYKSIGYESLRASSPLRTRVGDSSATFAAGAIYSTAGDLFRWNRALYGNRIISQASLEQAFTPYQEHYGFGWVIDSAAGKRFVTHNGGNWGFQTHIKQFPSDSTCIILLRNENLQEFEDCGIAINRILFYDYNYYIPRKTIPISRDDLEQFTGRYELTDNIQFKAEITVQNDHLLVAWTNMKPEAVFAEKKDFFHFKVYDLQLAFTRDTNGQVIGFTAGSANGKNFVYKRIP